MLCQSASTWLYTTKKSLALWHNKKKYMHYTKKISQLIKMISFTQA